MIAYLKDQDVTVELPDDISEKEIANIQKDFSSYAAPQGSDKTIDQSAQESGSISEWKPNFYQSHVVPFIQSHIAPVSPWENKYEKTDVQIDPSLAGAAMAGPSGALDVSGNPKGGIDALMSSALSGLTFGAYRPTPEEVSSKKDHPVFSTVGDVAGGIGSLMVTGGALQATRLPALAVGAGEAALPHLASAPRFLPRAIMSGATFGTNTFIKETVQALQAGDVDIADFGESVAKDTSFGSLLGVVSGIGSPVKAVSSAFGLGFLSSKAEGGDNAEAALNGAIWGIYEAVGSFGREKALRKEALDRLGKTIGEYVNAKDPKLGKVNAEKVGQAIVLKEAEKVGGMDAIVNSEKEGALKFIEQVNQKVRAKVKTTPAEAAGTPQITGPEAKTSESAPTQGSGPLPASEVVPQSVKDQLPKEIADNITKIESVNAALSQPQSNSELNPTPEAAAQDIKEGLGEQPEADTQESYADAEGFASSKKGAGRNYGDPGDFKAKIEAGLGGMEYIQKMKGPELVKLARSISGDVPSIKKIMSALGYFRPGDESIALHAELFQDQKLWEAVLAHEIGHLMDFQGGSSKTMARGNILGRIATLKNYRASLLPESPKSTEKILTDEDRRGFRAEAEKIVKAGSPQASSSDEYDPAAILAVWRNATGGIDPDLELYIKKLSDEQKVAIVKAAMKAEKSGEKMKISGVSKKPKIDLTNPSAVADVYKDLIKKEILKRKLWEEEIINQEMRDLSMYWKPFDPSRDKGFTSYRFSSAELYADFVSVLLNAPGKVKSLAPNSYKAFFNYIEEKPEVLKSLMEVQSMVQADDYDLQKIRVDDILSMYERGEDAFKDLRNRIEESKKSLMDKLKYVFIDKASPVIKAKKAILKNQPISPAEDAQYAVEKNSMMGSFVRSYVEDLDRLVYNPSKAADVLDEVKIILFLDRVGADRSEMANPLGHTPETAKQALDYLEKTDPAKFAEANRLAGEARSWLRKIQTMKGASDFFTAEDMALINMNDKYASIRVTKHLKEYLSAGFAKQFGTLEDINDPLTATAMKGVASAIAIERNRLKKITGEMMIRSGSEMIPAKVTNIPGQGLKIQEPPRGDLGTLAWKDKGKWVAYHTDKHVAELFDSSSTEKVSMIGGVLNTIFANDFFRKTYITFNLGFQSFNLIKDFSRFWHATPNLTIGKAFKLYTESVGTAVKRAKGEFDPIIQEMERSGALQLTLNDLILGKTTEDSELEAMFEKYDITHNRELKAGGSGIAKRVLGVLDAIRFSGDVIETIPKVAGWKALDYMDEEERSYFVRNLIGTPNSKRSGAATPISNSLILFSNIQKEGYRGFIELAMTNDKTRKDYWKKTMASTFLPKILMALAAAGLFGKGVQSVMNKASEYHKTNHVVVPLGVTESGDGAYLTLPMMEDSRLIGGLFWKMLNHKGNLVQNLSDILSFGADQFPGMAPLPFILGAWIEFLKGGNPRDKFRGQDILTEQERLAGGMEAFEPMIRWTLNETGITRLDIRDRVKNEPITKTVVTSLPMLNRFIRINRQGEYEVAASAKREVASGESKESLKMKDEAIKAIKKGVSEEGFTAGAKTFNESKKRKDVYSRLAKGLLNDPYVMAALSATSNAQKAAVLREAKKTFETAKQFEDYVNTLVNNKIISPQVAIDVTR